MELLEKKMHVDKSLWNQMVCYMFLLAPIKKIDGLERIDKRLKAAGLKTQNKNQKRVELPMEMQTEHSAANHQFDCVPLTSLLRRVPLVLCHHCVFLYD